MLFFLLVGSTTCTVVSYLMCSDMLNIPSTRRNDRYVPKESDLTLQNSDTWFYQGRVGYRSLVRTFARFVPPPSSSSSSSVFFVFLCFGILSETRSQTHTHTHMYTNTHTRAREHTRARTRAACHAIYHHNCKAEMVGIYHTTVGHGTTMLLNVAPPPNSTLPSTAIQEYAKLGKFIAECYGVGATPSPTALASTAGYCANCTTIKLTLPETSASATTAAGVGVGVDVGVGADGVASTSSASASTGRSFDRFLIKEDMAGGQRVRAFTIDVDGVSVFNGSAIGRSLIALLPANVTGKEVTLTVTAAVAMPSFRLFAVPNPASCIVGGGGGGGQCALQENTFTLGPASQKLPVKSVAECCTACGQEASCAIFMAVPTSTNTSGSVVGDQGFECSLIIAEQGSRVQAGVVSGSPNTALF